MEPFDELRAHDDSGTHEVQRWTNPRALATLTLRLTHIGGPSLKQGACWPDGQIRRSRVRVLAVD